jgi:hypothetical protein
MTGNDPLLSGFRAAVKILDGQRRMLTDAGADADIIKGFEAIVRHLHRMPEHQITRLLGREKEGGSHLAREKAIRDAQTLSLEEVDSRLYSENVSRSELEAIAIGRFHVPRGSMRSLRNMDLLRQKIQTLVENERMHATIADVAKTAR